MVAAPWHRAAVGQSLGPPQRPLLLDGLTETQGACASGPPVLHSSVGSSVLGAIKGGCCGPNTPQNWGLCTPTSTCSSDLTPFCSQVLGSSFSAPSPPPLTPDNLFPVGWV